jgi:hypothetical protein
MMATLNNYIPMKRIRKLVSKMYREGVISNELRLYLILRYQAPGKLKGNPKLHKSNAPLRTIVSFINPPAEKIAELRNMIFVIDSPTYNTHTTDFISKLKKKTNIDFQIQKMQSYFVFMFASYIHQYPESNELRHAKKLSSKGLIL